MHKFIVFKYYEPINTFFLIFVDEHNHHSNFILDDIEDIYHS